MARERLRGWGGGWAEGRGGWRRRPWGGGDINRAIWDVEDELRECETRQAFGPRFVELARSVYRDNDRRAAIKRLINEHLGLRGYLLIMRVERAANLRDLHDLLPDVAKALVKRIGLEAATPIVADLEQLIGVRPG